MIALLRRWRMLFAFLAVFAAALLIPGPSQEQVREWTDAAGPFALLMFLAVHIVATVAPVPRVIFSLSAGLLFGPVLGSGLAVLAATISAVLALLLVRALGRDRIAPRLTHPAIRTIDQRLERRGWLAVGSLRLIAAVPFAIVNYCAALSSVRLLPYLLATAVGIVPSTIGSAVLGAAITGGSNPALLAISATFFAIGVIGLIIDARIGANDRSVLKKPLAAPAP